MSGGARTGSGTTRTLLGDCSVGGLSISLPRASVGSRFSDAGLCMPPSSSMPDRCSGGTSAFSSTMFGSYGSVIRVAFRIKAY